MKYEFRTYEQDLKELSISDEQYGNIISKIQDKTSDEMMAIAKDIKEGGKVSETVRRAFERVLDMEFTGRLDVYLYYYSDHLTPEQAKEMRLEIYEYHKHISKRAAQYNAEMTPAPEHGHSAEEVEKREAEAAAAGGMQAAARQQEASFRPHRRGR